MVAFYVVAAPVVRSLGFPSLMAIYLAILFVLIPLELGYFFYRARKNGWTLGSGLLYREALPMGHYVALVLGLLVWSAIIFMFLYPPLDAFFIENVFFWLPDSFFLVEDFAQYSTVALLLTWFFGLLVNAIAGPVVEELYFRGYLLPRIERLGRWAILLNVVLFAFHHLWTPLINPGRVLAWLPIVYMVWRTRNIQLGMNVHLATNLIGVLIGILSGG